MGGVWGRGRGVVHNDICTFVSLLCVLQLSVSFPFEIGFGLALGICMCMTNHCCT